MKTWIIAHPYWATGIGIAIIAGAILLIRYLIKDKAPETSTEPTPEPAERLGWQRAFTTPVIPGSKAGVLSNVGAGMSGARGHH